MLSHPHRKGAMSRQLFPGVGLEGLFGWLESRHLVMQLLGTLTNFLKDSRQATSCVKKMYWYH